MCETRSAKRKNPNAQSKGVLFKDEFNTLQKYGVDSVPSKKRQKKALVTDSTSNSRAGLDDSKGHYFTLLHLTAGSLLQLTRVSHALRDIILSKRNKKIWVTCLSNLGAPSCPDDLTEPKYTSLIFDRYCNVCTTSNDSVYIYYDLRIRLCSACLCSYLDAGGIIVRDFDRDMSAIAEVYTLIPFLEDDISYTPSTPLVILQEKLLARDKFLSILKGYKEEMARGSEHLSAYVTKHQQQRKTILIQSDRIAELANLRKGEIEDMKHELMVKMWKRCNKEEGYTNKDVRPSAFEFHRTSKNYSQGSSLIEVN